MKDIDFEIEESNNIDIKEYIQFYLSKWKWFLLSFVLFFSIYAYYIKHKLPSYNVQAIVLVKDDDGGVISELSPFEDLGIGIGGKGKAIENEIEILKSRFLFTKVAKELDLNIQIFDNNNYKKNEYFINKPLDIEIKRDDSLLLNSEYEFEINCISVDKFEIKDVTTDEKQIAFFGKPFKINNINEIKIKFIDKINLNINESKYIIKIVRINEVVDNLKKSIKIEKVNKESSALSISTKIENINKGIAIINNLIKQHKLDAIEDKNMVAKNTIIFINDRIKYITNELSGIEDGVSMFKTKNDFFDLKTKANIFLEDQSINQKLLLENQTKIELIEFVINYLNDTKYNELVPSNLGIENISIEKLIETVNNLQLEKNKLLSSSSEHNPVVIELDNEIKNLRNNLKESLINHLKSLKLKNKNLIKQNDALDYELNKAPSQEKDFKEIQRQQTIKESLYLYLLQKREETSISYAVTASNTKIIDEAYSNGIPVSPKKTLLLLATLIISIIIPFSLINLIKLFDTKVKSKKDITQLGTPYLGDIPIYNENEKIAVKQGDRSSTAEAFRMLKTNISFIKNEDNKDVKTIFITSTLSKEGKSFVSLNLAATYGLAGKNVLLIGLDLRAPKILEYLNLNSNKGISNYLINDEKSLDHYIISLPEIENVSILPSGPIPPNPSELLNSNKFNELFKYASDNFDMIIVDTAPVGLVTDTIQISHYADMFVYVVRANYLDKKLLQIGQTLYSEKKLKNMAMVLNGSDLEKGYGYGYGYGEEVEKKSWWKKPFSKK